MFTIKLQKPPSFISVNGTMKVFLLCLLSITFSKISLLISICSALLASLSVLSPFRPSLSLSLWLSLLLSGWAPAVHLVVLVAGVTALLSGVAADQGGRRAGEADRS